MDCTELREILGELAGNRMEPGLQRAAEMHLERCPQCARELTAMRAVVSELRQLEPLPVPAGFVERVRARAERARPGARFRGWLVPAMSAAGATAAILLLVFLWPSGVPVPPLQTAQKSPALTETESKAPPTGVSTPTIPRETLPSTTGTRQPRFVTAETPPPTRPGGKPLPGAAARKRDTERPITVAAAPPETAKEGTTFWHAAPPAPPSPALPSDTFADGNAKEAGKEVGVDNTAEAPSPAPPKLTEEPGTLTRTPGHRTDHAVSSGAGVATSKAPAGPTQVYLYSAGAWADQPANMSQARVMNQLAEHQPVTVSLGLVPGGGQANNQMAFNLMANSELRDTNVVMNYQNPTPPGIRAVDETQLLWRGNLKTGQVAVVPLAPQSAPFLIRQAEIGVSAQGDKKGEISRKYLVFLPTSRGKRPDTRLSVNYFNVPLEQVIAEISERAGLAVMVSMPVKGNVVLRGNAVPAGTVLRQVAEQQGYQVIPGPSAWTLLK